jgi:1-deoxy-D-xylulose 5-phosphate reductoisomerase
MGDAIIHVIVHSIVNPIANAIANSITEPDMRKPDNRCIKACCRVLWVKKSFLKKLG